MTKTPHSIRTVSARPWTTLTLAGTALGLAFGTADAGAGAQPFHVKQPGGIWLAAGEGGEGGEGGEAGAALIDDEAVMILVALGQVEGHLRAGVALYEAGDTAGAASHMKHPKDEIYEYIAGEIAEHGGEAFADQLSALSAAVEGGADTESVRAAFAAVLKEIDENREHFTAGPADTAKAIEGLLRVAADEYGEGVKAGTIAELHEYQDAWGFVATARIWAAELGESTEQAVQAVGTKSVAAIDGLAAFLPEVSPQAALPADDGALLAVAAQVELAAYALR